MPINIDLSYELQTVDPTIHVISSFWHFIGISIWSINLNLQDAWTTELVKLGVSKWRTPYLILQLSSGEKNNRVKCGWWLLLQVEESTLHLRACTKGGREKKRHLKPAKPEEYVSPLRAFKTIPPQCQYALPNNVFSSPKWCGDAILSQVNLQLCWLKNGHSFCKWTAPLCPWILHPGALQRCSQ